MPNIKSAKKRVILTEKANLRNRSIRSALRTSIKKADAAIDAKAVSYTHLTLPTSDLV